jgi:uncharacterized phage protein (TIGR01671 family)
MKDYKFRGKRKDNGEWVFGYFFASQMSGAYILSCQIDIRSRGVGGVSMGDKLVQNEVDPETVGQYIGLHDNKRTAEYPEGQEMYVGDIVKDKNCGEIGVIRFGKFKPNDMSGSCECGYQCFFVEWNEKQMICGLRSDLYYWLSRVEIIGNIYSNPELIP